MKKTLYTAFLTTILTLLFSLTVFAGNKTCAASGCNSKTFCKSSYCSVHTCAHSGCTNKRVNGSNYCSSHQLNKTSSSGKSSYSSNKSSSSKSNSYSSKKNSSWDSYDKGYEDVWLDDDYDWDRYQYDSDYADGVDDAMDDCDW